MKVFIHLRSLHDPSGNPQRLFVVLEHVAAGYFDATDKGSWHAIDVIDEGYLGREAVTVPHPDAAELFSVEIPRAEYHSTRRWWRNRAESYR